MSVFVGSFVTFSRIIAVMGTKLSEYPHEKQEVLQLLAVATDAERLAAIELRDKQIAKDSKNGKKGGKRRRDADSEEMGGSADVEASAMGRR